MEHSIRSVIQSNENQLTKSDHKVARVILADYPTAGLSSLADLGEQASVSAATVLRFVAKIGFDSFPDFQSKLKTELQSSFDSPLTRFQQSVSGESASSPLEEYASFASDLMKEAAQTISSHEFDAVATMFADNKRPIHVIGGRFSRSLAEILCFGLGMIRGDAHLVRNDARSMVEALMDINKRSIVVVFDFRRYQQSMYNFAKEAGESGAHIVLITDRWRSPCEEIAQHMLTVPVASPSAFDSGLAPLMCIEALVDSLAKKLKTPAPDRIGRFEELYEKLKSL